MSRRHALAGLEALDNERLRPYVEALHDGDPSPALPEPPSEEHPRRLRACGTGARGWSWSPGRTRPICGRLRCRAACWSATSLSSASAATPGGTYQDALIYPKGYTMSRWEQAFYDLARREAQRAGQA